ELAEKCLERSLTYWTGDPQAHFWMARTCRRLGKFDKADEHLRRCEDLDWALPVVEVERTLMSAEQGHFIELESTLLSWAKKDNADTAAVQEVLVHHYAANSQIKPALYWGERFLKQHPDHIPVLKVVGFLHNRSSNPTDGLNCYRRLVEMRPEDDEA